MPRRINTREGCLSSCRVETARGTFVDGGRSASVARFSVKRSPAIASVAGRSQHIYIKTAMIKWYVALVKDKNTVGTLQGKVENR
eukprot:m.97197 g.97197  ORF g.97197 m.97197 type:complete len:85 (+) comp16693_c0_seq2:2384-2638(+)